MQVLRRDAGPWNVCQVQHRELARRSEASECEQACHVWSVAPTSYICLSGLSKGSKKHAFLPRTATTSCEHKIFSMSQSDRRTLTPYPNLDISPLSLLLTFTVPCVQYALPTRSPGHTEYDTRELSKAPGPAYYTPQPTSRHRSFHLNARKMYLPVT